MTAEYSACPAATTDMHIKRVLITLGMLGLIFPAGFFRNPAESLAETISGDRTAPSPATMSNPIDNWIRDEAIPFSLDSPDSFNTAVERLAAALDERVELLGIGEPLHGGEEFLLLRNRLFRRLAEKHNFSAIAVESCFVRGRLVNDYVQGSGNFAEAREKGVSHGFGELEANRELVEWMREHNGRASSSGRLRFYGFDSPTEMVGTDSPRPVVNLALDNLAALDPALADRHRRRIEPLLGRDSDWENPAATFDPDRSIGRSSLAAALRSAVEDLISDLNVRRPALAAQQGGEPYALALRYARTARQLLDYHSELASRSDDRVSRLLGIRDAMMADHLAWIVERERGRGKVLVFAHNSHLKRGEATMQLGPLDCRWWPAGAQVNVILGPRYAVIGAALGTSAANGIAEPEAGTLEARLAAAGGAGLFLPTRRGKRISPEQIALLPVRSGSGKNPSYFPLTPESLTDFDWLAFLDSAAYTRGAPPLPDPNAAPAPTAP